MKFDQDWAVPLAIAAAGILTGLIAWLVTLDTHIACHLVIATTGGRPHMIWACR